MDFSRMFGWNPRGTTNSEYGRFVYQNNFVGTGPPGRNFGGENWAPNNQQHQPGCQNYVYGQDLPPGLQKPYQYHEPGCHNNPQEGQNQDNERPFDVFVGEEAATEALGGKEQFQTHFPTYGNNPNNNDPSSQTGGGQQQAGGSDQQEDNGNGGQNGQMAMNNPTPSRTQVPMASRSNSQMPMMSSSKTQMPMMSSSKTQMPMMSPSKTQMPMMSPSKTQMPMMSSTSNIKIPMASQVQNGEEPCEPTPMAAPPPQPVAYTQIQPDQDSTGGGDGGQQAPTMENSNPCKIPPKWRGLPPNIQYGRHIRPLYAQRHNPLLQQQWHQKQQQQQQNCLTDAQLQEQLGMGALASGEGSGSGDMNSTQPQMPMSKPNTKRVPIPATAKYMMNNKVIAPSPSSTTNTPASAGQAVGKKTGQSAHRGEAALCGKCPKCKDYLPPVVGPSVMSFPKSSTANLQKPNLHKIHSMTQQDAKNFKAVRYHHHHNNSAANNKGEFLG